MIERVAVICPNIGIVYSGMGPDFRVLVARARKSAQAYWKMYGEYPPTRVLTRELASIMQQATHSGCVSDPVLKLNCRRLTTVAVVSGLLASRYLLQAGISTVDRLSIR